MFGVEKWAMSQYLQYQYQYLVNPEIRKSKIRLYEF